MRDPESAVIGYETSGVMVGWSPGAEAIFGYSSAEVLGSDVARLVPSDRLGERDEILRLLAEGRSIAPIETVRLHKDGRRVAVELAVSPIADPSGAMIAVCEAMRELSPADGLDPAPAQAPAGATRSANANESLLETKRRFERIVHATTDAVWDWDVATNDVWWNEGLRTVFGYPEGTFEPSFAWWHDRIHPDDRDGLISSVNHVFDAGGIAWSGEYRFLRADGSYAHVFDRAMIYRDASGRPLRMVGGMADITERKHAEEALRQSEERFRATFERAGVGVAEVALDGRWLRVNQRLCDIVGYSSEELLERTYMDITHPDDLTIAHPSVPYLASGEIESISAEKRYIRKDGSIVWVDLTASRVCGTDGEVLYFIAVIEDITHRKEIETALRDRELRYRSLVHASPQLIWRTDAEGVVVELTNFESMTEMGGQLDVWSWMEVVHPDDRERVVTEWAESMRALTVHESECRILHLDGRYHDCQIRGVPVFDGETLREWIGTMTDISDRKRAERRLVAQEAVSRALAESDSLREAAPRILRGLCEAEGWDFGAIWSVDELAGVLRCVELWSSPNVDAGELEAITREIAYAGGEGLPGLVWSEGAPVRLTSPPDQGSFPRAAAARRAGMRGAIGFPILLAGDVTGVVDFFGREVQEPDTRLPDMLDAVGHQIGVFVQRKRAQEALHSSEERLRQSQKMEAVGRLAGGVAHDFNNLLTIISGYGDFIMLGLRPEDPVHKFAQEILKASERAATLTRQLLAFSRKQLMQPVVLDLNRVVGDMGTMLGRLIGEDVEYETNIAESAMFVLADPGQLEQVLVNLVVNARDAMPSGGTLLVETSVVNVDDRNALEYPDLTAGEYAMLVVTDTGMGMDAETRERIFEPFYTTKEQGKGTGLGLATVYGIVVQSGGTIRVHSAPGRGSTFEIYLPSSDAEHETPTASPPITGAARDGETVLLVEDEDAVRAIAVETLKHHGYAVLAAQNAGEAILTCETFDGTIHILVTDVVMPKMHGRDLAARLATIRPELRVLYMSGYSEDVIEHHGVIDEHIAFLEKPFTPEALARKVREVLDSEQG